MPGGGLRSCPRPAHLSQLVHRGPQTSACRTNKRASGRCEDAGVSSRPGLPSEAHVFLQPFFWRFHPRLANSICFLSGPVSPTSRAAPGIPGDPSTASLSRVSGRFLCCPDQPGAAGPTVLCPSFFRPLPSPLPPLHPFPSLEPEPCLQSTDLAWQLATARPSCGLRLPLSSASRLWAEWQRRQGLGVPASCRPADRGRGIFRALRPGGSQALWRTLPT